jgi:hypothetical protein
VPNNEQFTIQAQPCRVPREFRRCVVSQRFIQNSSWHLLVRTFSFRGSASRICSLTMVKQDT